MPDRNEESTSPFINPVINPVVKPDDIEERTEEEKQADVVPEDFEQFNLDALDEEK